ncbi:MAG: hypothetical protein ABIG29_01085 [Candidatus Nealsonbacteria bacterium]
MEISKMVVRGDRIIVTGEKAELNHVLRCAGLELTKLEPMKGLERGTDGVIWDGDGLTIAGKENVHSFIDAMMDYAKRDEKFWAEAYVSGS